MTFPLLRSFACVALVASPTYAADVRGCDDIETGAAFIAEPWEANTRTFANGDVRIAILDHVEPAAAAYFLLVLSPPRDDFGMPTCRVISFEGATGYADMSFDGLQADYDPTIGLTIDVPIAVGPDAIDQGIIAITLNPTTGALDAQDIGS
ncbi:MAG: hypothetical protein ACU0GG_08500 [Paracoccaceae bacterium]